MNKNRWIFVGIAVALVALVCCAAVVIAGGLGLVLYRSTSTQPTAVVVGVVTARPTSLAQITIPAPISPGEATPTPGPGPQIGLSTPSAIPDTTTLTDLEQAQVPVASLLDLAERLKGIPDIPATETPPKEPFQLGAAQKFWVMNNEASHNFQVDATLQYVSPHLYFWVENGLNYDAGALKLLGDTFENKIYPTDRKFFGSEWSPGVDGDVHLYILYAGGLGPTTAGYYSSVDEYDPRAHPYSNAHEMFYINADHQQNLADPFIYGILAHEFQHMIHWNRDRNEEAWMNEGFSEVAMLLNGYYSPGPDQSYIIHPDLQLDDWPNSPSPGAHDANYGASFLFLDYFLNRFGDKVTQDLVGNPKHGLESIDTTLASDGVKDANTGAQETADTVFADWAAANYLQDPNVGDGRYAYANYSSAPQAKDTGTFSTCPVAQQSATVHQYGVEYYGFTCQGDYTLKFTGSDQVHILGVQPHSGKQEFWSNMGDESDMTLTHSFDFANTSGPITLKYSTWYDLEKDFDYVYLETRTEGGPWQILKVPHGTDTNPNGSSYGNAYTGASGGWIQEQVDLSAYAGKKVDLRFEYVTDAEVNGDGFLLDDVSIPQVNYQTDFEKDSGGWSGAGFVRVGDTLPQTFQLSLILEGNSTTVQTFPLQPGQTASIPLHIGGAVNKAVLVVSGTTRFTRQQASFQFSVDK